MRSERQLMMLLVLYVALFGCDEGDDQTEEQFVFPDTTVETMNDAGSSPTDRRLCLWIRLC